MSALEQLLGVATDDQLRATRRLLHRAYLGRDRLGWPTLNPFATWRGLFAERQGELRHELGEPDLLPAMCLEISAELTRRSAALPCLPCEAQVSQSLTGHLPRVDHEPVPSAAASRAGG